MCPSMTSPIAILDAKLCLIVIVCCVLQYAYQNGIYSEAILVAISDGGSFA